MANKRRTHRAARVLAVTLVASAFAQVGALYVWHVTHPKPPPPPPKVSIVVEGYGTITSHLAGFDCGFSSPKAEDATLHPSLDAYINGNVQQKVCSARLKKGSVVKLVAVRGDKATFEGWSIPCGRGGVGVEQSAFPNLYMSGIAAGMVPWAIFRAEHSTAALHDGDPMECTFVVNGPMNIKATFGHVPDKIEVAEVKMPEDDSADRVTITLPDPDQQQKLAAKRMKLPKKSPRPKKKLAKLSPTKPLPKPKRKPKPKPKVAMLQKPKPKKLKQPKMRMKSVEVPDEHEVKKAPKDARFLSDKNRDVAKETRARNTNLEKQRKGKVAASEKSALDAKEVGGKKHKIAQMENTEPTSLTAKRVETNRGGRHERAQGVHRGNRGGGGDGGRAGKLDKGRKPGMLSMRHLAKGAGLPGGPMAKKSEGRRGRPGKRGRPGIKTKLNYMDYERLVGKKVARLERELGKKKLSMRRGRWARKRKAIMASLENFNSEVRPGNQTALKTRAAPFALYIARMHRKIHELWGFGFLEDLNDKPADHPLNNMKLWTDIEIVINSDGTIHKTTIIRNSGRLEYDVAALDVIYSAAPYQPPPRKIRSPDGRVYIHWAFYRNHRQCGTFNARPFILAKAPKSKGIDDGKMLRNKWRSKRRSSKASSNEAVAGDPVAKAHGDARAHAHLAAPDDPAAKRAAAAWVRAFVKGDIAAMAAVSGVPFRSRDRVVANNNAEIQSVYKIVLAETSHRQVLEHKLFSPAEFRRAFGRLPPGLVARADRLLLVVRLPKERFTLELSADGRGGYKITGFHR